MSQETVLAEDTRRQVLNHLAEQIVGDWFKTVDKQSIIDLLTGHNAQLNKLTDDELVRMIAD